MNKTLQIEVECPGKVLEGEGFIGSKLQEKDYGPFGEALKLSIVEIEEPECAACIDGRCTQCQKNNQPPKIRPRKAGGSISTLVMMGLGDRLFLDSLQDNTQRAEDIYSVSEDLQLYLGNKESGHEDCGAASATAVHVRAVGRLSEISPAVSLTKKIISAEYPDENSSELANNVISQANAFAALLDSRNWDGNQYVEAVASKHPEAVEILQTKNDPLHGHAEQALVVVDGPVDEDSRPLHTIDKDSLKQLYGKEAFIVNLNELRRDANLLGGTPKQKAQLLTAALLHHIGGVYKSLGDGSQPLFVVRVT